MNLKKDSKDSVVDEVKVSERNFFYSVFRYSTSGMQTKRVEYSFKFSSPKYDSIVDRSNFSIDADRENVRKSMLSGSSLLSDNAYDSPDNPPSDLEVKMRSGKFDKAEIQMIQKRLAKDVSEAATEQDKKTAQDRLNKINEARQTHLDKLVGFTSQPEKE